jgi:asparagine synthase (glutamine-hydrolysing)
MSMATSLEMRSPLLDHVVIELAASLPVEWKLRNGESKYILKKLAERIGVPREVLYRKKQGFAVPLVDWFRKELRQDITDILLEPQTLNRGYYREQGVRRMLDEHLSGRRDRSEELWLLLVFELWHRNFLAHVRQSRPEPISCAAPAQARGGGLG